MKRDFLGTYRCHCGKRVRVYGWLPEAILCASCTLEIERQEKASLGPDWVDSLHPSPVPTSMSIVTNKVVLGGVNVRLFVERKDAINMANRLTGLYQEQHEPIRLEGGWLVRKAVQPSIQYDADGKLPAELTLKWEVGYYKVV